MSQTLVSGTFIVYMASKNAGLETLVNTNSMSDNGKKIDTLKFSATELQRQRSATTLINQQIVSTQLASQQ